MRDKWQPMVQNGCADPARGPVCSAGGLRKVVPPGRHSKNGCAGRTRSDLLIAQQRVWQAEAVGAPSDAS
jgi:hypothetical protein